MSHQLQVGQTISHPEYGVGKIEFFRFEGYYAKFTGGVRVVTDADNQLAKLSEKPAIKKRR